MYIHLLDIYSEYLHTRKQIAFPDIRRKRVKLFDTIVVQRIINDQQNNKGMDLKVDDYLLDFFEYDIFILPFLDSKINRGGMAVVQLEKDDIMDVQLWDRHRPEYSDDEIDRLNSELSAGVFDFLQRAHTAYAADFKPDNMEGSEKFIKVDDENEMIPAILQLAEAWIINQQHYVPDGNTDETRHKIVDRLVSLYLME